MSAEVVASGTAWPSRFSSSQRITPRRRAQYRHAISIAMEYFNYGSYGERFGISEKAGKWAREYFADSMARSRAFKEDSDLVKAYPDLLNTSVSPHLRLRRQRGPPKPISVSAKPLQRIQREEDIAAVTSPVTSTNPDTTEPFPAYVEPLLATEEEMDEIVEMRVRQPANKPVMRVTPADLRGTGLLDHLPEFMAQLSRANFQSQEEKKNGTADAEDGNFELDEDQAKGTVHVEMNIVAGVLEEKADDADGEGEEETDEESAFQLAIPSAGTLPSASTANAVAPKKTKLKLIRPVSSGSDASTSSSSSSSRSPDRKQVEYLTKFNNPSKVTKPKKKPSRPVVRTASGAKAKSRPAPHRDNSGDENTASSSTSPSGSESVSHSTNSSETRRPRVIIHTPASRERSRQRSAELEERRATATNSSRHNSSRNSVVSASEDEDAAAAAAAASARRKEMSPSPVRRIILKTKSWPTPSPAAASTSCAPPSPVQGGCGRPMLKIKSPPAGRKRARSSSVQSQSQPEIQSTQQQSDEPCAPPSPVRGGCGRPMLKIKSPPVGRTRARSSSVQSQSQPETQSTQEQSDEPKTKKAKLLIEEV